MNLRTLPPHAPFLDSLAAWWLHRSGDDPLRIADGLILLPTRRAARALTDAFLAQAGGRPLLLPRIAALGALDEAPLALSGSLDLPPAVDPMLRLAQLTRLVMALDGRYGAPSTANRAWELAAELAALLDEAHRAEVDLHARLPDAAADGYAEHWQRTVEFLEIVTAAWPAWLQDNGLLDPADRQVRLLDCQARHWQQASPAYPVVVAGTTGGIASVNRLMRVVAGLPEGWVVLPGLDLAMPDEVWDGQLDESHPQFGLRQLLNGLGAARGDVSELEMPAGFEPSWISGPVPPDRCATLWRALLPADAIYRWRDSPDESTDGLRRLTPADQQEEAAAIALALRGALETPHARAALVTPDRQLAVRVAAELGRFGVVVDDSAGEPLADTPPGAFLRLAARAVADGLRPVPLLALLKHPLAALGLPALRCREAARHLEMLCLRGPAPAPGLAGLRAAVGGRPGPVREDALDLLARLEARLGPVMAIATRGDAAPAAALDALLVAAEALAETDAEAGALRLWAGEEGEALATHLAALRAALPVLPPQPVATLPGLLDSSMQGAVVRSRRALRGRDADGREHPRVQIWGLLEARLQTADLIVLGGLAETVWPPATDPGPWMSRPMRAKVGLPSPEEGIGLLAHDFVMAACAAPDAVLSCPHRREGGPAVPARWLVRLDAYLAGRRGRQGGLLLHPAVAWSRALDQPAGGPRPARPPQPRPPVESRPRSLRVTDVETWLRDPYSIHARYVLKLRPLDPLEPDVDAADYGSIVHGAMASFLRDLPPEYPADAPLRLRRAMDATLDAAGLRPALVAWWRPRLARIAVWAAEQERLRRQDGAVQLVRAEVSGEWQVPGTRRPFRLRGRADRIDRLADGRLAILDYKTGVVPSGAAVEAGFAPQLPLEAAMAAAGAFGPDLAGPPGELTYWHLSGGFEPGKAVTLLRGDAAALEDLVEMARDNLAHLVDAYDDPARPYLSQPQAGEAPRFPEYAQLARVAEWAVAGEG